MLFMRCRNSRTYFMAENNHKEGHTTEQLEQFLICASALQKALLKVPILSMSLEILPRLCWLQGGTATLWHRLSPTTPSALNWGWISCHSYIDLGSGGPDTACWLTESWSNRVIKGGRDLKGHAVQLSIQTATVTSKSLNHITQCQVQTTLQHLQGEHTPTHLWAAPYGASILEQWKKKINI